MLDQNYLRFAEAAALKMTLRAPLTCLNLESLKENPLKSQKRDA